MVRLVIKAIVFDYYGVVCPRITPSLSKEISKQFGIKYTHQVLYDIEKLLDLMDDNSITFYEYWKKLKADFENKDVKFSDHQRIWKECTLKLEINPQMKRLINGLRKMGYIVPVLSNVTRKMAKYNRIKGRYKIFSPVFLSCEIGLKKPSIAIFEYILKKMKVEPSECIFIDDKENSLKGAKAIGIKTILFKNISQLLKELRKAGVYGI